MGLGVLAIGGAVLYFFVGPRLWSIDPDLVYLFGALIISVPAIVIYEMRKRRKKPY